MEQTAEGRPIQRSPALPPLLPHTPPQHSKSRGRRFTAEEKLAFGSRPFVLKCNLAAAEARSASPSRVLQSTKHDRFLVTSQSEPSLPSVDGSTQMQEMLERMLPTHYGCFGDVATLRLSKSVDSLVGQSKVDSSRNSSDDSSTKRSGGRTGASKAISVFTKDILEKFRLSVLKVHRSLHDAFSPLERRCYFSALVGMAEVRTALSRVDAEAADELLVAVPSWPAVSLSTFFEALINSSPEAAIWELSAGLSRRGVWPNSSKRSLDDLQAYMKSHAGNVFTETQSEWTTLCESTVRQKFLEDDMDCQNTNGHVQSLEDTIARCFPLTLSPELWNHFCTYLGLNSSESKKLLSLLSDSRQMDLRTVFEAVRVTASPDASIPRLAIKAVARYDSLRQAFRKYCTDSENVLRWFQFRQLARTLDISDKWAMKLWALLTSRIALTDTNIEQLMADARNHGSIHEEVFVQRLSFWPPGSAMLQDLKLQLRQAFGDIQEARKAFRKHGLPSESTVTPQRLLETFRALGITKCDPDVILRTTRRLRGFYEPLAFDCEAHSSFDPLTLDDVVDAMRSQVGPAGREGQGEAQALRKQLRDVCGTSTSSNKRKRLKRNASAPPAIRPENETSDLRKGAASQDACEFVAANQDNRGPNLQVEVVRDSKQASFNSLPSMVDDKVTPAPRNEHSNQQLAESLDVTLSIELARSPQGSPLLQSPIANSGASPLVRHVDATPDPRKLRASISPSPAARILSATITPNSAVAASVSFKANESQDPMSSNVAETNQLNSEQFTASGPFASPQPRSPPTLLPKRSPSLPHGLRHSNSAVSCKEFRLGQEILDSSPRLLNSTSSGARMRAIRTRSMSPLPAVSQNRNGFTSEPSCSPQTSDMEPPRNAWSTASSWHSRKLSESPAPKSRNHSANKELQMLETCSSFFQAEDDAKLNCNLVSRLGSNSADDAGSFVQATAAQKSGFDTSVGKLAKPWR